MTIFATNRSHKLLDAIQELARYRDQNPLATAFNVGNSFHAVNADWRKCAPKTEQEILNHYRTCESQVEQQVFATYGIEHEVELRKRIVDAVRDGEAVLDLGAGIGSTLLDIGLARPNCQLWHADVQGPMMRYARWRYSYRRIVSGELPERAPRLDCLTLDDGYLDRSHLDNPFGGRTFCVVVCTEVIEHVLDPVALVKLLAELVRPSGRLFATTSFHDDEGVIPMHLNLDKWSDETFAQVFEACGFRRETQDCYVRV